MWLRHVDSVNETTTYDCPNCLQPRPFEQVLDLEERRTDTDEWACTVCGAALFVDPALELELETRRAGDTTARRVA